METDYDIVNKYVVSNKNRDTFLYKCKFNKK